MFFICCVNNRTCHLGVGLSGSWDSGRWSFVLSPQSCFSLQAGNIINSFGTQIHREHVKHEGCRAASRPCWVRVKGFVVRNTDCRLASVTAARNWSAACTSSFNVQSGKMWFTPALRVRTVVGNKESPFQHRLVAHTLLHLFTRSYFVSMSLAGMSVCLTFLST